MQTPEKDLRIEINLSRQSTTDSKQGYAAPHTKQETIEITREQTDVVKCG